MLITIYTIPKPYVLTNIIIRRLWIWFEPYGGLKSLNSCENKNEEFWQFEMKSTEDD